MKQNYNMNYNTRTNSRIYALFISLQFRQAEIGLKKILSCPQIIILVNYCKPPLPSSSSGQPETVHQTARNTRKETAVSILLVLVIVSVCIFHSI